MENASRHCSSVSMIRLTVSGIEKRAVKEMPLNYPDSTAFGEKGCLLICGMIMSRNMNLNCGDNTMLRQLRRDHSKYCNGDRKMLPVSDAKRIDCIYRKNSDRLFQKLRPGGNFSLFHTEIIAEDTAVWAAKGKQ